MSLVVKATALRVKYQRELLSYEQNAFDLLHGFIQCDDAELAIKTREVMAELARRRTRVAQAIQIERRIRDNAYITIGIQLAEHDLMAGRP